MIILLRCLQDHACHVQDVSRVIAVDSIKKLGAKNVSSHCHKNQCTVDSN